MQKRKSLPFQFGSHEIALEPGTPIEYFEEAARVMSIIGDLEGEPSPRVDKDTL